MTKYSFSKVSGLFLMPALLVLITGCPSGQTKDIDSGKNFFKNRREQLKSIQDKYAVQDCFRASYKIEVRDLKGKKTKFKGALRADNKASRMSLKLQDPFFGMTLGRITVREKVAYIDNPLAKKRKQKKMQIPLEHFYVRGLGQNNISLPFRLFQDLLYARLPAELFTRAARVKKNESELTAVVKRPGEEYTYVFTNDRLTSLNYKNNRNGAQIFVTMNGQYRKSIFPANIMMRTAPSGQRGDQMKIMFRGLNLKATCSERNFPKFR